ncbi:MAG: tRNA (adenosine(37)-N6)-threonylcarbamoyltransferase complex transferase subunit TsaD [Verrucomicrobia bacterium]|nr:tRNA (adenosine(37)-N6)-threonylcarbamoyltransferase complex transferase subunit TsaD [Verrucomicrobiota bacterium]
MILAIESSCDESALALFDPAKGVVRELISSQAASHEKYGGVVPELASRMHLTALPLLLEGFRGDLPLVTRIAVTRGPGLLPCLSMGVTMARALAMSLKCPLVGVNHLRAHVHSAFIPLHAQSAPDFPAVKKALLPHLGMIVSGGNTLLVRLDENLKITVVSRTVDDAAGEAFDKGARLLGLPYPGGALVEKLAQTGDKSLFTFPRGIPEKADLRMSFSGLKTALRYQLEKMSDEQVATALPHLCASYQDAILAQLLAKTHAALGQGTYRSIGLSGGVGNNRSLRERLQRLAQQHKLPLLIAEPKHCGDNASMIAFAAWTELGLPEDDAAAPAPQLTVEAV